MMKKSLLLSFAALLLQMTMFAQSDLLSFNPSQMKWTRQYQAPAWVELPANQKIMGHYSSDSLATTGYALLSTGLQPVAVMLEPDELDVFQGGKIVAFRVGLVERAEVTRVFVVPVKTDGKYGDKVEWTCEVSDAGWNVVNLETPYEINLEEGEQLLIGFYFKQTAAGKPLSLVQQGQPYDTYTYKKVGTIAKWRALGIADKGNLSVQCIVEKDNYPDYSIASYGLRSNDFVQVGEALPFEMNVKNKGIKTVEANALTVNVMIDGKLVGTATNVDAFFDDFYTLQGVAPTDGLESGDHVLSVQIVAVDGVVLENMPVYECAFKAFQRVLPRQKHLVEQLTSTYCTYCPLGNSMLSILTQQRDDVIWVGIHGNLGSGVDPFRSDQGDTIMTYLTGGYISYPSGVFDRTTGWDDENSIANGLGYSSQYHQEVADVLGYFFDYITESYPTFAEINAVCLFDEVSRKAWVSVDGEISSDFNIMMGEDALLTVYIVEDSLYARQLNMGTWENQYLHNGVFRKALGTVFGNKLNVNGDHYKNSFSTTIPSAWNWENLRVVAFISRPLRNAATGFTDMYVNNAEVFKFKEVIFVEPGDVNGDGEVNIADINALIDIILSGENQPAADVNGDNEINIADINAVIDMILQ